MSLEENKAFVRRFYEEIFNQRNVALAGEFIDPQAIDHEDGLPGVPQGPEGLRYVVNMLASAFPDFRQTIDELVAEGDTVVVRATLSGTHQGEFMGIPPTGKRVSQQQAHFVRLHDGKIAEHRAVRDDLGMLRQLGVIPAPASGSAR